MGGAAGHMSHPFDLGWVSTGSDLLDFFEKAKAFLEKKGAGAVKIDGVNVSFKIVGDDTYKQFAVDRGSMKSIDIDGITMDRVNDRFPEGHGMRPAIQKLLIILNKSLPDIVKEVQELGMWDDPTRFLNTEYVEGTTNVTEYDENFLAIHGLSQFYQRIAQSGGSKGNQRPGRERPEGIKTPSVEVSYDLAAMENLVKKLNPIAEQYGFKVYGSVPTEKSAEIDYSSALSEPFTVRVSEDREITKSLSEWLSEAVNPRYKTVKMRDGKKIHALHKELYKSILKAEIPIVDLIEDADAEGAIYGAVFMHATRMLGSEILKGLTSPMGDVINHEGVVLRDEKVFGPDPVKITGEFIVGGTESSFQKKAPVIMKEEDEEPIEFETEEEGSAPVVDADAENETTIALVPGAFKPPHLGHLAMVEEYAAESEKVIVLISQPLRAVRSLANGHIISGEDSKRVWDLLTAGLPNVEVKLSPHATPISAAYAMVDRDKSKREAAARAAGVAPLQSGNTVILGASTKDNDWKRWTGAEKYVGQDLQLIPPQQSAVAPSVHSPEYMGLLNMSPLKAEMPSIKKGKDPVQYHASDMRYLLDNADRDEEAIELLEDFIGEDNIFDLLSIFGIDTGLNETTSMAGGSVAVAAGKRKRSNDEGYPLKGKNQKKNKDSIIRQENLNLSLVDDVIRLIMERGVLQ